MPGANGEGYDISTAAPREMAGDELPIALPPGEPARAVEGPEGLSKAGPRYPIPPRGAHMDPAPGMARSYPPGAAAAAAKRGGKQGETRA